MDCPPPTFPSNVREDHVRCVAARGNHVAMASMSNRLYPLELDLQRESHLRIRWSDGREGNIPLPKLRRACPCATCRAMREEEARNPLRVLGSAPDVVQAARVASAELVGNYALRITWRDGHD